MMRRSVAVVLGLIFTLAGGLAALSGGAMMALFGSNGTLTSDPEHLSTPTTALVTTVADVDGTAGSARSGGRKHRGGERPELRPVPARQGTSGVDLNARLA